MATQILIIHGQLPFAIKLKQALERSAPFEAHPFTTVEAALDYLQDHIQDVALVDFALPDFPGDVIVRQLRTVQPNIIVIATPRIDRNRMGTLEVLASLDNNFPARDLVNLVNDYFAHNERPTYAPPPTTALLSRMITEKKGQQRPAPKAPENLPEYTSLDDVLSSAGGAQIFEAVGLASEVVERRQMVSGSYEKPKRLELGEDGELVDFPEQDEEKHYAQRSRNS